MNIQEILEKTLKAGADNADIISVKGQGKNVAVRLGKVENIEGSNSNNLGIRVMIKGKKGYKQAISSTNDLQETTINETIENLINVAKNSTEDEYADLASKDILYHGDNIKDLDLYDSTEIEVESLIEKAKSCEDAAMSVKHIKNSEGSEASSGKSEIEIISSNGFHQSFKSSSFGISASVIAEKNGEMQTDYDYDSSVYLEDLKNPAEIGKNAGERTANKLGAKKISSAKVPVIFEQRRARSLIGSFLSAINGAKIARKSSFLQNKMNELIFPEFINITDDPLVKRGKASQPFDGEGVRCEKMDLVKDGILQNWTLDIRSANKLGLKTNGRASRGISSLPSPSSTNIFVENGNMSLDEMLEGVKQGLFLTEAFGMGINGITGDYSQGAAGFWIENGEITFPVNEITIASNLSDMFKNMNIADDVTVNKRINTPTIMINEMTIAGV